MLRDKLDYVHAHPEIYFTKEARKGGYVCPVCENGSGSDGTGVRLIKGRAFQYKCFKCGTTGDVVNFYATEHNLSNGEALREVFRLYGLDDEENFLIRKLPRVKPASEVAENKEIEQQIKEDIRLGQENLRLGKGSFFFQRRGISKEVTERYGCGFIAGWVHPKLRGRSGVVASDRAIIPTGAASYVARVVDVKNSMPKLKAGKSEMFNVEVLKSSIQNVVVVEGEFDALSIIEVGNDAIALGSTQNVDKLLSWLKESGVRPKKSLIIDLDADEAGRSASAKLTAGLAKLKIRHVSMSLVVEGCKDQNESLVVAPEAFKRLIREIPQRLAEMKRAKRRELSDSAKVARWENSIANARDAISTGWKRLDKALEGGLYEGLYVIPGATGTGKTAFALQMAYQIASQGKDVLYISLEMGEEEIYERHISRLSYELYGESSGAKSVHSIIQEKRTVEAARQKFEQVGLYLRTVCGVGSIDADDIRQIVERYEYELETVPVVFVDYLQILKAHDPRMTDKQAVDYNVLRLKQLSRDFKIPVVALASMNRTSYSDVISMVSIKESGAIEYTSDVCIGLQMAAMDSIVDGSKGKQGQQEKKVRKLKSKLKRDMQAVILKQRNGPIGAEISLTYCAMFNHFADENTVEFPDEDVLDI